MKAWEVENDAGTELVTHFYRGGEEEDVGVIGTPEYLIETELNHEAYSEEWNDVVNVTVYSLISTTGLKKISVLFVLVLLYCTFQL